jgi:small subunit ribosomal protein S21
MVAAAEETGGALAVAVAVVPVGEAGTNLTITVHGNDIEKALRDLKRTLQRDGLFKELKRRRFYEKPSVKKKRKQVDAERRRRKAMRFRRPDRD